MVVTLSTGGLANACVAEAGAQSITAPARPHDMIVVLAGGVRGDRPTPILEDRLVTSLDLYRRGAAPKLLLTGNVAETIVMQKWLVARGVPEPALVIDAEGIDTYTAMYRARWTYGAENALIVTQKFHMPRALYLASSLGLTATGAFATEIRYTGDVRHPLREMLARPGALFDVMRKRPPGPRMLALPGA